MSNVKEACRRRESSGLPGQQQKRPLLARANPDALAKEFEELAAMSLRGSGRHLARLLEPAMALERQAMGPRGDSEGDLQQPAGPAERKLNNRVRLKVSNANRRRRRNEEMNPAMLDMGISDINGNNGNVSIAPETGADVLDLGDYRLTRSNRLVELLAAIPGELPAPFTWEGMACYAFDPGLFEIEVGESAGTWQLDGDRCAVLVPRAAVRHPDSPSGVPTAGSWYTGYGRMAFVSDGPVHHVEENGHEALAAGDLTVTIASPAPEPVVVEPFEHDDHSHGSGRVSIPATWSWPSTNRHT